jgi:uncharacterized protein (TIGR02599 family)
MKHHRRLPPGFTLMEILVSIMVLCILLVLCFRLIDRTSNAWLKVKSATDQFREARVAFEALSSRLTGATLNQYRGYEFAMRPSPSDPARNIRVPVTQGRRSELRFLSGPAQDLVGGNCPTHAVFFTAPTGFSNDPRYNRLSSLLNVWGFYIEWSNVDPDRPSILPASNDYRFRLMQFVQPAEDVELYAETTTVFPQLAYRPAPDWQRKALAKSPTSARPLAENVVALILLPATSTADTAGTLAPRFTYDSQDSLADTAKNPRNRLPPVMRVLVYSIDEVSARRLGKESAMPDLYSGLFTDAAALYTNDLARFEERLTERQLNFQRHEMAVEMLPQPWSTSKNGF